MCIKMLLKELDNKMSVNSVLICERDKESDIIAERVGGNY